MRSVQPGGGRGVGEREIECKPGYSRLWTLPWFCDFQAEGWSSVS